MINKIIQYISSLIYPRDIDVYSLETDYMDDPMRPGAVLGPKTVPKRKTAPPLNTDTLYIYNSLNSKRGIAAATSAILLIAVLSVLFFSGPSLNIWEAAKVGDIKNPGKLARALQTRILGPARPTQRFS